MRALGPQKYVSRVKHAGGVLTRLRVPINHGRPRPAGEQSGTDRALKIDDCVVMNAAQLAEPRGHLLPGVEGKEGAPPFRQVDGMDAVDQRPLRRTRSGSRITKST